jgi:hypothetical protein
MLEIDGETVIDYNDQNSEEAIDKIKHFSNNFGGTNILEPLLSAQT